MTVYQAHQSPTMSPGLFCKFNKFAVDFTRPVCQNLLAEAGKANNGTLRVSEVKYTLLSCLVQHIIYHVREIYSRHLVESKGPESV